MVVVEADDLPDYLPFPTAHTALSPRSRPPVPTGSLCADLGTDRSVKISTQSGAPDVALGIFTSDEAVPPSLSTCYRALRPITDSPPHCVLLCYCGGLDGCPFSGSGWSGCSAGSGSLYFFYHFWHPVWRPDRARSHVTFSGVIWPAGGVTSSST